MSICISGLLKSNRVRKPAAARPGRFVIRPFNFLARLHFQERLTEEAEGR